MKIFFFCTGFLAIFFFSCNQPSGKNKQAAVDSVKNYNSCGVPLLVDKAWYTSGKKAPIFNGLDHNHFPVTTKNAEAQKYFDQGLMLSYGFNHAEAARSFYEVFRLDATCAMGWWGFAYVMGPNYNAGMERDNFQRAYDAVQKAKSLSISCTHKEKDLIEALSHRYSGDTSIARSTLDSSFAFVMRRVYKKYPEDADIAALFAESLMNLHPWNLWKKDGTIQPWTPEILGVLEKCLLINPKHVGGNHFYIHAQEMSHHPEKSSASADLLMTLVPGSGHLLHMSSHTYIRMGRYHDGVIANEKAVLVDSLYTEACHAQGIYPLSYYPHNYHFLAGCAALSGESKKAIAAALATADHAHTKLLRDPSWATLLHYYSIPWYIEVKLGLWKNILLSPAPDKDLKYPTIIWHYAQAMAELSLDSVIAAKKHLDEMKNITRDSTLKNLSIWGINNLYDLSMIATKLVDGEIHAKEKDYPASIALLQQAMAGEDALNYNEPPDWFFSIRHHLGAIMIDAGKYDEAIKLYHEDLKIFPENGWALRGLMNAYEKLGDKKKYEETKIRFEKAWQYADMKISSSRIL